MRVLLFSLLCLLISACSHTNNENTITHTDATVHPNNSIIATKARSFFYDPDTSIITGVLCKKAVYGVTHEDSPFPPDTILTVVLKNKVSVVNAAGEDTTAEGSFPNEYDVDTVQLMIKSSRHDLDKSIGHVVSLKGLLFHGDNGSHFTNVLLDVKEVRDSQTSTVLRLK